MILNLISEEHVNIDLVHNTGFDWTTIKRSQSTAFVKGFVFWKDGFYKDGDFANLVLSTIHQKSDCEEFLKELNGSFAIVIVHQEFIMASVDRVRSIPLFYTVYQNRLWISDDIYSLQKKTAIRPVRDSCKKEFLLTGYVTGSDTLLEGIFQIQSAEYLYLPRHTFLQQVVHRQYYEFIHHPESGIKEKDLGDRFNNVLIRTFTQLLKSTGGCPLVIPLSGGYDSRLIVAMLKLLGREKDVYCYTYSLGADEEVAPSKKVAEKLNYPWIFIKQKKSDWRRYYRNDDLKRMMSYGGQCSSTVPMQDFGAILEMKKHEMIPSNSIIIPGHTGDFIAGGHIPRDFQKIGRTTKEDSVSQILLRHYIFWRWNTPSATSLSRMLGGRVEQGLPQLSIIDNETASNSFQYWVWKERQSKLIVNSCRVYDYWGYSWRLPFWNSEYMAFWEIVPFSFLIKKAFYDRYLIEKVFSPLSIGDIPNKKLSYMKKLRKIIIDPRNGRFALGDILNCLRFYSGEFNTSVFNFDPRLVFLIPRAYDEFKNVIKTQNSLQA